MFPDVPSPRHRAYGLFWSQLTRYVLYVCSYLQVPHLSLCLDGSEIVAACLNHGPKPKQL